MCTSKCGGACISLLKDKTIDSKQSLEELSELLHNLTVCGVPSDTDTNNFMKEVNNLKMGALGLLNEAARNAKAGEVKTINSLDYIESIFEELSFKERLNELKKKIQELTKKQIVLR